jgi:hypothetical protein
MSDLLLDRTTRQTLLADYADGARVVLEAVARASDDDLDRAPSDGGWTARTVVHHLADAEVMSSVRLRRLLGEEEPEIAGYDENHYARVLRYDRPIAAALQVVVAVRALNSELLAELDDNEWARRGTHSEDGPYGVERWLEIYTEHAHGHARQIRDAMGGTT